MATYLHHFILACSMFKKPCIPSVLCNRKFQSLGVGADFFPRRGNRKSTKYEASERTNAFIHSINWYSHPKALEFISPALMAVVAAVTAVTVCAVTLKTKKPKN
jgi:hypothetical protein